MEETKKKKQEEKKKKDAAQKKATEQKTKVPDSAKPSPTPPPPPPANPITAPSVPSTSSGNGKRPPCGAPPTQQPPTQSQPPQQRYPAREVPPRFRQQEHKQLLKRGQPLPPGTLPPAPGCPEAPHSPPHPAAASLPTEPPPQIGWGTQYDNPHWGQSPTNRSAPSSTASTNHSSWNQLIAEDDPEAWPFIQSLHTLPEGCGDTDAGGLASSSSSSSSLSMATGASGQTGHYPANHPSSKTSSAPGLANHTGPAGASSQAAANRGWGSGPAPSSHCSPQSSIGGGDSKSDGPMGGGGGRGWGAASSSASNFNLNLNPNANPSAWPVLGHDGAGAGGGSSGGANPNSPPQPPPSLCNPPGAPSAQGNTNGNAGTAGGANSNLTGSGSAWGGTMPSDPMEPHPSPSTNVSFSSEPQNLNTDGPNHASKQESPSPIHSLASWGGGHMGMPPPGAPQVNGEESCSVWGNIEDPKPASAKEVSGWDSGSGWNSGGGGGGGEVGGGGWGTQSSGEWGKRPSGEAPGWEAPSSPPQDQQAGSWSRAPSNVAASEGSSSDSAEGHSRHRDRPSRDEPAPLLPTPDLDPRVLCNTGWGQTPVRQHTTWDMEEAARLKSKNDPGTNSWGSGPSTPTDTHGPPNHGPPPRAERGGKMEGPSPQAAQGWGGSMPTPNPPNSGWGEPPSIKKPSNNGPGGWGNPPPGSHGTNIPKGGVQSWGEEKSPSWDEPHSKATKPQGWGGQAKPSQGWGNGPGSGGNNNNNGGGDWGEPGDGKKNTLANPPWEGEAGGWKESPRGWGKPGPGVAVPGPGPAPGSVAGGGGGGGGGWGDTVAQRPSGPAQGWERKPQEGPNGNSGGAGSMGSWGGTGSMKQGGASSWAGGSKPEPSGGEPTGWEEPSPPSIRRKMEIDDGTSAWGDPTTYSKAVNLWDRNNPGTAQGKAAPSGGGGSSKPPGPVSNSNHSHAHPYHGPPPPLQGHGHNPQNPGSNSGPLDAAGPHLAGPPHSRPPLMAPGWGEPPPSHPKPEPSWGEPAGPPVSVDNGTSAWGKPTGSHGGWGDNGPDTYSRGNPPPGPAPCKPAPKTMQDGWGGGGEELGMSGGQWDTEDGDMWNSTASQESNSSCNSWGNGPKKGPKVKMPGKQEDAWIMNRLTKQLTDMGFPRDPAEEALKSNNMNLDQAMSALLEKKSELDKRGGMGGMSDYNNSLINKPMACRPPLPSSDRSPFLDKMQGGMFGSSGAAQVRALQQQQPPPAPQPSVPPLSSSQPSLRAQVPQFISPQVQAQLLQFAAKNIGLNPALLTSPINPQHMTLLNQLYQLQLAYQRLQIQQQMLQAQRNVSGPIRQQEQQVARTINNMQQQIQQHQRQLAQALLMKQQQQPPSHLGLHAGPITGKSALDSFPGHPQAPGLPDLQTKESSPNCYSPYPLSGLNPNMNVNCMEVGGLSMKEPPMPQSRLSQWTHPNSMESLSGSSSPLESNLGKHGAPLGPPGKPPLDDSYSSYNLMPSSDSPTSPLVPPDSWGQGKTSNDKMANGTTITWPPEFCPGVPWKGLQNIDPENDPNMTPGSVPSGPTINTNIQDVNRYLLRDRSGGKLLDIKSTWSPGPISHTQASLSHELWKVPQGPRNTTAPSRPPPGLTNTKPPSSTWGGNSLGLAQGWSSSYTSAGTTWSTDSSNRTSSWLVLRNLTPQIDGSTLRTLCMQHGPLITFHLNLTQGNALVRYSSKDEAAKAQKSLHMCVLGNTTILAEFAGEEEVNRFFAQGQSLGATTSWQANPGANQTRMGGNGHGAQHPIGHWNSGGSSSLGGGGPKTGGELLWGGVPQYSSLWGPPSGEEGRVMGSPTPINTLLPGDLLSGESM